MFGAFCDSSLQISAMTKVFAMLKIVTCGNRFSAHLKWLTMTLALSKKMRFLVAALLCGFGSPRASTP